jgi:hypothetical protein
MKVRDMAVDELRDLIDWVVEAHGHNWERESGEFQVTCVYPSSSDTRNSSCHVLVFRNGKVEPHISAQRGEEDCARVVALWPQLIRMTNMLREALK